MFYVYILYLENKDKYYTGYTEDLRRRLREHQKGSVKSTKSLLIKAKLIYYEAFISKFDAERREKYLKTTQGKRMLKILLKDTRQALSSIG